MRRLAQFGERIGAAHAPLPSRVGGACAQRSWEEARATPALGDRCSPENGQKSRTIPIWKVVKHESAPDELEISARGGGRQMLGQVRIGTAQCKFDPCYCAARQIWNHIAHETN